MDFEKYHYGKQNFDDRGFGCSYRNIQNIISALNLQVPHITELFKFFFPDFEQYIKNNKTRKLWIEPYDISEFLFKKYNIIGKNLLYTVSDTIDSGINTDISIYMKNNTIYNNLTFELLYGILREYFEQSQIPIVIDDGVFSYCMLGINRANITILDPHKLDDSNMVYDKDISFFKNKLWLIYIPGKPEI